MPRPDGQPRGLARVLISIVVIPILIVDEVIRPLYGPVIRAIARLRLLDAISAQIARLPPYGILCVLAVPFIIAEPLKVVALYWTGTGHLIRGAVTLAFAYGMSFIIVERIYDAGRDKLMQIAWLSRLVGWVGDYRDAFLSWLRATGAWQRARSVLALTREHLGKLIRRGKTPR